MAISPLKTGINWAFLFENDEILKSFTIYCSFRNILTEKLTLSILRKRINLIRRVRNFGCNVSKLNFIFDTFVISFLSGTLLNFSPAKLLPEHLRGKFWIKSEYETHVKAKVCDYRTGSLICHFPNHRFIKQVTRRFFRYTEQPHGLSIDPDGSLSHRERWILHVSKIYLLGFPYALLLF